MSVAATCNPASTPNTPAGCNSAGGSWVLASTTVAAPVATGTGIGSSDASAADKIVVFGQAGCSSTSQITQGGIREMAIVYKLEGQSDITGLGS